MTAPNILLLVLDAVRPDHLSCYGHHRETTPNIDALAANGVVFENAFATSNWTATSHGSMFTGLLPSHSGIYGDSLAIPDDVPTLPERLQQAGYRTFGASAGAHIRSDRGYDRGFDVFEETYRITPSRGFLTNLLTDHSVRRQTRFSLTRGPDKKTLYKFDRLRRWLGRDTDRPFFAFLNAKTAHHPYNPPRPYKSEFCPTLDRPRYEFLERLRSGGSGAAQDVPGMDMDRLLRLSRAYPVIAGEFSPTDEEWETMRAWYDGAIRYMDCRVGELLARLDALDLADDTYIFVTADHGELFGEHGLEKHYYSLYDGLLRVPLVVSTPDSRAARIENQVSLVDLFPTILDIVGESIPDYAHSTSLDPFEDRQFHDLTFAELGIQPFTSVKRHHPDFDDTPYRKTFQTIRDETHKLIRAGDGSTELYNWLDDPGESTDLVADQPEIRARLEERLVETLAPLGAGMLDEDIDDPALEQQLKDLGYL